MLSMLAFVLVMRAPTVYVSPAGNDSNAGTQEAPLRSVQVAIDKAPGGTVVLADGRYPLSSGILLSARHNGTKVRADDGATPVICGSTILPRRAFTDGLDAAVKSRIIEPAAREKVLVADLSTFGIPPDAGMQSRGFPHQASPGPSELIVDDKPQTLSRWPNNDYVKTGKVLEPGDKATGKLPSFIFDNPRLALWSQAKDAWLYGYWQADWADESMPIKEIDASKNRVEMAAPHCYKVAEDKPFYAENLLEEIDQPGEYYIDRSARKLYVYPPDGFDTAAIEVTTLADPLVAINDAKNVHFVGVAFANSRGDGAQVFDSTNVTFEGCTFHNLGARAALIERGTDCGLLSCDVWATGEGGVALSGGDRKKLTNCNHFVQNCDIRDFSRRSQTYHPAITMNGCGCRASNNRLHDNPHSAIIFWGNEHVIELNEVYKVVSRTGDGGVFYTGRDWTARGNVIRWNYIHDCIGIRQWENAIYLDDMASGTLVQGNLIADCHWGMLIGGGRDNTIEDNVIVRCKLGMRLDGRGLGWAKNSLPTMRERLEAMPYKEKPWSDKYPSLVGILDQNPMGPVGNIVRRNILLDSGTLSDRLEEPFKKEATIEANLEATGDLGFADLEKKDFRWKKDAKVFDLVKGFEPMPFEQVGLQKDKFRKTVPDIWNRP